MCMLRPLAALPLVLLLVHIFIFVLSTGCLDASKQLQCFIAEGVPHDSVVFEDNAPLLELFEHKQMGVFAQLSEACMYPRPNDGGLVTKLGALHARWAARGGSLSPVVLCVTCECQCVTQAGLVGRKAMVRWWQAGLWLLVLPSLCRRNPCFSRPADRKLEGSHFVITHSTGPVTYGAEGFIYKNRDRITSVGCCAQVGVLPESCVCGFVVNIGCGLCFCLLFSVAHGQPCMLLFVLLVFLCRSLRRLFGAPVTRL